MGEAIVINVALTIRVLLVGGFLQVLPRITRKGLLFGAYIGEELAEKNVAGKLLARWTMECVILMGLSLVIGLGISLAGWPLPGNFTGTAVLLLGGCGLYLRFHAKAQKLAPPVVDQRAAKAVASIAFGKPQGVGLARTVVVFCSLASLVTFVYSFARQEGVTDRSFAYMMWAPSLNLALSPFLALLALLTANAKRSLRGGSGGGSLAAQESFRRTMASIYTWSALLFCGFMTFMSVQLIRYARSEISNPGLGVLLAAVVVILFMLGNLIRIMGYYGQGGSQLEHAGVEAPLTNGLADNTHWLWGLFYIDRDDPSIMVESRFGVGYTFNYGRWSAILITVSFGALALGLLTLTLFKTFYVPG